MIPRLEARYECHTCGKFRLAVDPMIATLPDGQIELSCGHRRASGFANPLEGLGTIDDRGEFHQLTTQGLAELHAQAWREVRYIRPA